MFTKNDILEHISISNNWCWEFEFINPSSWYWRIQKRINWSKKAFAAHRVSYELYKWIIGKWMMICHKCDNRKCCNPDHLFEWTGIDNTRDMINKWRWYNPWPQYWNNYWWKKVLAWWILFESLEKAWKHFWVSWNSIKKRCKNMWPWYEYNLQN